MDESDYGSIGFMFDSSLSRQLVHLKVNDNLQLDLYTLGDDQVYLTIMLLIALFTDFLNNLGSFTVWTVSMASSHVRK